MAAFLFSAVLGEEFSTIRFVLVHVSAVDSRFDSDSHFPMQKFLRAF